MSTSPRYPRFGSLATGWGACSRIRGICAGRCLSDADRLMNTGCKGHSAWGYHASERTLNVVWREGKQMKFMSVAALLGAAAFTAAVPSAASAQHAHGGSGYDDHDQQRDRSHDGRHNRLEDRHDDNHDELNEVHADAHDQGLSRRGHRRLHRDLRSEHARSDYQLDRQHQRQDRRAWQRQYYNQRANRYYGY